MVVVVVVGGGGGGGGGGGVNHFPSGSSSDRNLVIQLDISIGCCKATQR